MTILDKVLYDRYENILITDHCPSEFGFENIKKDKCCYSKQLCEECWKRNLEEINK